jgi:riboflavin biosynthesis pyrimidine reductase
MTMVDIESFLPEVASSLDDQAIADHYAEGSRPNWLRVNFVSSIDGAVTVDGKSGGLGGDADRRVFDILRRLCDVVLVAAGTVRNEGYGPMIVDDSAVIARVERGLKPQPTFAIVSGSLDLDPTSPIFTKALVKPVVITTESSDALLRERLATVAHVLVCGEEELDVGAMIAGLAQLGLTRIHCEGGPSLFGTLLAADVMDELCLTVSPLLAAGDSARIAHGDISAPRSMCLAGVLRSEDVLLLRYIRTA